MGLPFSGPVTNPDTCCDRVPGTYPPDLAPYVKSINSLQGIVLLEGDGQFIYVDSTGNTIKIHLDIDSVIPYLLAVEDGDFVALEGGITIGTGSVKSVGLSSTTLTIGGTNPVTDEGTISVNLTGAVASIQALTTAADQMIYTTASNTYATTTATTFGRSVLASANAAALRVAMGAQTESTDLDAFVTYASWSGNDLTLAGDLTVTDLTATSAALDGVTAVTLSVSDAASVTDTLDVGGVLTAASFAGVGSAITALNASNVSSGTLAVARGGTNLASYTVGDIIYASGSTALSKLAAVTSGSFLRSAGATTAPEWSTLKLPNAATTGDLLYASASNSISALNDVATGYALISGGVGVAPSWGKITTAHAPGFAGSGDNTNITAFTGTNIAFNDGATFNADTTFGYALVDAGSSPGTSGQVLVSLGTAVQWESDLDLSDLITDTLRIDTALYTEGTIIPALSTGAQTINKMSGTVRIAASGTSVVVTNSLCSTSSRVLATCSTNDATAWVSSVVTASGSFTIYLGASATAEVEISWILFNIT